MVLLVLGGACTSDDGLTRESDTIDDIAQHCFEGELAACDDLAERAKGEHPELRLYGLTCGRRILRVDRIGNGRCTGLYGGDEVMGADEPTDLQPDPELDRLAQACSSGDLRLCGELASQDPAEAAWVEYGATCGMRNKRISEISFAGENFVDCVDFYGADEPPDAADPGDRFADEPELELAQDCFAGTLQSCDELRRRETTQAAVD